MEVTLQDLVSVGVEQACPMCSALGIASATPERAARMAPDYIAELRSIVSDGSVPKDGNPVFCWDCRKLECRSTGPYGSVLREFTRKY